MPTVTVVRVKGFLSGVVTTLFEISENILTPAFAEDNILWQLHQKLKEKVRIVFYGDKIWSPMFGRWYTRFADWSGV